MKEKILTSLIEKVKKEYPVSDENIKEAIKKEVKKEKNFGKIFELDNLHFEKNKNYKELLKRTKREIYHNLRQYDRADVLDKEKILLEIRNEYKKNSFSEKCINLHLELLKTHVSTVERTENFLEFYSEIFKITGKPKKILDIGSGINSFSIPFMKLDNPLYVGIEKKPKDVILTKKYLELIKDNLQTESRIIQYDLFKLKDNLFELSNLVSEQFDCAFLLKVIPIAERFERGISNFVLKWIKAKWIIISCSRVSMVKGKDIEFRETSQIKRIIKENNLKIEKTLYFKNEVVFITVKN